MESSAVARYLRFFRTYQEVKQGAVDADKSKITPFMEQVVLFVQRQKEVRRKTAARFNLFETLARIFHKTAQTSRKSLIEWCM
jgi:hypothetical protein